MRIFLLQLLLLITNFAFPQSMLIDDGTFIRVANGGVDYVKLIPIMIKTIQEQQKQIEEIKSKIK